MFEFIIGLFFFFLGLFVFAAVGHGIWVLMVTVWNALFGGGQPATPPPHTRQRASTLVEEIEGSLRQLDRLRLRELITDADYQRLRALCVRDLERLHDVAPSAYPLPVREGRGESPVVEAPLVIRDVPSDEPQPVIEIIEAEVIESAPPPIAAAVATPIEVHPLDRMDPEIQIISAPVHQPQRARRALADVLTSFMLERNIRWGEIVSGLLIVGSATGLVLSLRDQLGKWIPYFPAFLFLLGTAAIHAAGLYTLRRWNLHSTSRGVLMISMLLVPLNFLAAILISGDNAEQIPVASFAYVAAITIGLLSYGAICFTGARALVDRAWPPMIAAVLGTSAIQLPINRLVEGEPASRPAFLLAIAVAASFIFAVVGNLLIARRYSRLTPRRSWPLLLTLGLGSFSTLLPLTVIVSRADRPWLRLSELSPVLALIAATIVTAGVFIIQRTLSRKLATQAVVGSSLAIFGGVLMLAAVALAWPEPQRLLLVGGLCTIALAAQAFLSRAPLLHAPAVACATLASVVGFHQWQETFAELATVGSFDMISAWLMGRTALVLVGLSFVVVALGAGLWRTQFREHSLWLWGSAAGVTLLSLFIAMFTGYLSGVDAELATIVFAIYAITLAVATAIYPHRLLTIGAAVLLLATITHAPGYNGVVRDWLAHHEWLPDRPVLLATLFHACFTTVVAVALALLRKGERWQNELVRPLAAIAFAASITTLIFAILVRGQHFALHGGYVVAIGLVWLTVAALLHSRRLFTLGQAILSLAVIYFGISICQQQAWWTVAPLGPWRDPRTMALLMIVLSAYVIFWTIARRVSERWPAVQTLITPPWPQVDQVWNVVLVFVGSFGLSVLTFRSVMEELHLAGYPLSGDNLAYFQALRHPWLAAAIATVAGGLIVALRERLRGIWLILLAIVALWPCLLLAITRVDQFDSASTLRWSLTIYLAIMTLLLCSRSYIATWLHRLPLGWRGESPRVGHALIDIVLFGSAVPTIAITLLACGAAARGVKPFGPLPDTFFDNLGWTISYASPLGVIVAALLAFGLLQRHANYVLAGSFVWQILIALGCIMPVVTSGGAFDAVELVKLWQWSTIGLGVYALVWLAIQPWLARTAETPTRWLHNELIALQIFALLASLSGLSWRAFVWLMNAELYQLPVAAVSLGSWHSFAALAIAAAVVVWWSRKLPALVMPLLLALLATAIMPFVGAALHSSALQWPWIGNHTILSGWLLLATAAAMFACAKRELRWPAILSLVWMAGVVWLNAWHGWLDPIAWYPSAALGLSLVLLLAIGVYRQQHRYAYLSLPLALLCASQTYALQVATQQQWAFDFLAFNLLAMTTLGGWWLGVEIYRERNGDPSASRLTPPLPLWFTPLVTVLVSLFVALSILGWRRHVFGFEVITPVAMFAVASVGAYLLAALWYDRQRTVVACLFVWGLAASLHFSQRLPLTGDRFLLILPTVAAIYLALVGVAWQSSAWLSSIGKQLGINNPITALERASRWLPLVTLLIGLHLLLADLGFVLFSQDRASRIVAGFGPLLVAIAIAMQAQQARRELMIYLSLCAATISALLLGWADIPPSLDAFHWLRRLIRMLVVLGSLSFVYAVLLPRAWGQLADWVKALRRMSLTTAAGTAGALVLILTLEVVEFLAGREIPLSNGEIGIVAAVLTMLAATLVVFAVSPRFAPLPRLGEDEQLRMGLVYAAQIVLALTFAHLYLTRPYWFDGLLRPYWPYIVMALAFAGVGLGEWLQRMSIKVLGQPLQRTGVLLPLLPAIGWWIEAARGEPTTDYAFVMLVVGFLYVMFSVCRQSTAGAIAAAVAGNIALWSLMSDRGFSFVLHPQFWLIPPALCVLAGAQLQAHRLKSEQLISIRYVCMLVIYLSSTSEIFISGIDSIWPPLVLASLAVVGVLAGIAFQIRAFLYLGTSFVFLSMVTMVWHASRAFGQVWPWWVFGICVGLALLVLFGLFEKKRTEITALVERLRKWEQ